MVLWTEFRKNIWFVVTVFQSMTKKECETGKRESRTTNIAESVQYIF